MIGDDDLFDDNGFGDGWTLDNLPYGYAATVSALDTTKDPSTSSFRPAPQPAIRSPFRCDRMAADCTSITGS